MIPNTEEGLHRSPRFSTVESLHTELEDQAGNHEVVVIGMSLILFTNALFGKGFVTLVTLIYFIATEIYVRRLQ